MEEDVQAAEIAVEEPHTVSTLPKHLAFGALKIHNFQLYFVGAFCSVIGRQMLSTALGWDIYEQTHSALALGLIGLVQLTPIILLTLPAGHVADEFNRKRVILLTQSVLVVSMLALALASGLHFHVASLYCILFVYGVARAFSSPANGSILPLIVPEHLITNAITWNSITFQSAAVLGPALAGALIAWHGSAVLAYVCAGLFSLVLFLTMLKIKPTKMTLEKKGVSLKSLSAGLSYVWQTKDVLSAISLDLFAVLLGGAVTLMPIFARDILHVGPLGLGFMQAAPSIGALLMGLFLTRFRVIRHAGPVMLGCVFGFGIATIVFGLSHVFWLSFLMLFFTGVFDNISVVVRSTLIQIKTPPHLLGRVAAINYMFIGTSNELGGFESGVVAYWFGPFFSVISGGIGTLLVVAAAALIWPKFRQLDRIEKSPSP